MELTPEEKVVVAKALGNEKNLRELEGRGLRQSEFSKQMDELKAKQAAADAEKAKAADYYVTTNQWRMQKETEFNSAVEARIQSVRPQLIASGLTEAEADTILGGSKVEIKRGDPNPNPANGNGKQEFVTRKEASDLERYFAALPGLYLTLQSEHARLFGADSIPDWQEIAKVSIENGKTLKQNWEEKYNVQTKRDEIAKAAHEKEMKEAEERGAKAAMDKLYHENPDLLNRVANPAMPTSVIQEIAKKNAAENPSVGGDAARLARVAKAVEAWPKIAAEAAK